MTPWNLWAGLVAAVALALLQWGHGDDAVESPVVQAPVAAVKTASMGPRR